MKFPERDVAEHTSFDEWSYGWKPRLGSLIAETREWQQITAEQPDRLWRDGFVAIASWDSAYQMVVDSKGVIAGLPGLLAHWDFKGGTTYHVVARDFDRYLELERRFLEERLLFPPPLEDEAHDDFVYGSLQDRRVEIVREVSPGLDAYFVAAHPAPPRAS